MSTGLTRRLLATGLRQATGGVSRLTVRATAATMTDAGTATPTSVGRLNDAVTGTRVALYDLDSYDSESAVYG